MAGSFGFERDHYEVSQAIGELELLPAVRHSPADTLIIADGFSCREQILQATGIRALHLAQVLRDGLPEGRLEAHDSERIASRRPAPATVFAAVAVGALAGCWLALRMINGRSKDMSRNTKRRIRSWTVRS